MATFIMTWNGSDDGWPTYEADKVTSALSRPVPGFWSTGPRRSGIEVEDRVFLLRQHDNRGIVASGHVVGDLYEADHWDPHQVGRQITYANIEWDMILALDDRLTTDRLLLEMPEHHWNYIQSSGQQLNPPSDERLQALWETHLGRIGRRSINNLSAEWDIEPGQVVTRKQVADRFGGAIQGGIEPSTKTSNIMVYSDPEVGRSLGYNYDGPFDGAYYYTGEGPLGHQAWSDGNRALLEHASRGRRLRLFEAAGPRRPGGKPQRYLGAYTVDPIDPYRTEAAPDRDGHMRNVIVFRLLPDGATIDSHAHPAEAPQISSSVEVVSTESNLVDSYTVTATEEREAHRWEATLMTQLEAHLTQLGHEVRRVSIRPAGESTRMLTDTYDATTHELFEIKPAATRAHIRAAVAQLLDYRRHVEGLTRSTVLVPATPSDDLRQYIGAAGLSLAVFNGHGLRRVEISVSID